MKLFVKTATSRFPLDVNPDETIASVKSKLQNQLSSSIRHPGDQKLVFRGNVLKDSALVNSVLADEDTVLFLYPLVSKPKVDEPMPDVADTPVQLSLPTAGPNAPLPALGNAPALTPDLNQIINNLVGQFANRANAPAASPAPAPAAAAAPRPAAPAPQRLELPSPPGFQGSLEQLQSMGFSANRAKRALYLNGCNFDLALEWIFANMDNPVIDTPLTEAEIQRINLEWRTLSGSSGSSASPAAAAANAPAPAAAPAMTVDQRLQQAISNHKCTFTVTGKQYANQTWYYCYTCGLVDSEGMCESCKDVCHKGHLVSEPMPSSSFYCDCGAGSKCKAKN